MRGVLEPMKGVSDVQVVVGEKEFSFAYDPNTVDVDAVLEALDKAGESATRKTG